MSNELTIDRYARMRAEAERLARRYFRVCVTLPDISPYYVTTPDGDVTRDVNPPGVYILKATRRCPTWLRVKFDEMKYRPGYDDIDKDNQTAQRNHAIAPVVSVILRKMGYRGYVQCELPL